MSAADCKAARRKLIQRYRPRRNGVAAAVKTISQGFSKKPSGKK